MGRKRQKKSKKQEGNGLKSQPVGKDGNVLKIEELEEVQDIELKSELNEDEPTATKETPQDKPEAGGSIWTLGEFLDQPVVEPEPLLAPWLKAGDQWMVHAKAGIGKTFFSLNVAWAVACGGKYLGWSAPKGRPVLYVDGEMDQYDMFSRMQGIVEVARRTKRNPVDVEAGLRNFKGFQATYQDQGNSFPDLATSEGRETLKEHAEGMALVVIDNLSTTMRTGDENESKYWTNMQDTLVELRTKGTAVLLVHHSNKSGDQRGTSTKDVILNGKINLVEPKKTGKMAGGAQFVVKWEKVRGLAGRWPVLATLEEKDGLPQWSHTNRDDHKLEELIDLAQSGEYKTQKDLADALGITGARVSQIKKEAIMMDLCSTEDFKGWLNGEASDY